MDEGGLRPNEASRAPAADIDSILAQRQRHAMRRRWAWFGGCLGVLMIGALIAIPGMSKPVNALRLQWSGVEAQALVTATDVAPLACDSTGCVEMPYVIVNLNGGSVPPEVAAADITSSLPQGAAYLLRPIERHIASSAVASKVGDTVPVWFVANDGFPQPLTTEQPQNPVLSALVSWWWVAIVFLLIGLYPRIDGALVARVSARDSKPDALRT
jgi:hypothetical protein